MYSEESNTCALLHRSEAIAQLNDQLRQRGSGGKIMITQGVRALKGYNPMMLAAALATYDGFDVDNDPYGERDFGNLQLFGDDLLWKIDYYDKQLEFASPDPTDASVTQRILTVMLVSEY